jgi:predicted O-methyltransferase YrrM
MGDNKGSDSAGQCFEVIHSLLAPVVDYWLITDRFKDIEGYLDPIEGYALYTLAAYGPGEGHVVEIGSLYGRSTCYLASGCARGGRGSVYAVDTFQGSEEHQAGASGEQEAIVTHGSTLKQFLRNIANNRLDDRVVPVVNESGRGAKEWEGDIRLLFIDGDHSYEGSRNDFVNWSPYVTPNGLVAFHDVSTWDGVTRFYEELLQSGQWEEALSVGTVRVVQHRNREK